MFSDLAKAILLGFSVGFFLDTIEMKSFKLCTVISSLGVSTFIPVLMSCCFCQGHRCVRNT